MPDKVAAQSGRQTLIEQNAHEAYFSATAMTPHPRYVPGMSTVQEIENAISRLSPEDMRLVRDWLENQLEDRLEMTD
jgi:hypothetical protein